MRTAQPRYPSLLSLRAFEAAARRLSFTSAAVELNVSQAAVSRHVRVLEAQLDRPLFRRLHRAVELTPQGRNLAAALSTGFAAIRRGVDDARGVAPQRLRLSVEPAFAARWLVSRLGGFSVLHPTIEIQLETSDQLRVLGADADLAIRYMSVRSRRRPPRGTALFTATGVPVMRPRGGRGKRSPSDQSVIGLRLLHDDDGTAWRDWFEAAGLPGFDRATHQYFTDYSLVLAAAQAGHGVALGIAEFIEPELRSRRLTKVGLTSVALGTYWLLESRDRATRQPRAAFVKWLSEIRNGTR
jgi:LysR family transcriptional regulator, glycine cleavage system transcriptional activator